MPITVSFQGGGSFVDFANGETHDFSGANTSSQNCAGSNNAQIKIVAQGVHLAATPAGSYSTTLTLVLAPQ